MAKRITKSEIAVAQQNLRFASEYMAELRQYEGNAGANKFAMAAENVQRANRSVATLQAAGLSAPQWLTSNAGYFRALGYRF